EIQTMHHNQGLACSFRFIGCRSQRRQRGVGEVCCSKNAAGSLARTNNEDRTVGVPQNTVGNTPEQRAGGTGLAVTADNDQIRKPFLRVTQDQGVRCSIVEEKFVFLFSTACDVRNSYSSGFAYFLHLQRELKCRATGV